MRFTTSFAPVSISEARRPEISTSEVIGITEPGPLVADFEHLDPAQLVQLVYPVHVPVAHDAEHVRDAFRLEIVRQPLVDLHAFSFACNA